jgi:poly(hydroxyalkanoate) granule-associated protein
MVADAGGSMRREETDMARRKQRGRGAPVGRTRRTATRAQKMVRDAFESAQESVQTRLGSAREQAGETWENLEALFQSRVHKALAQIGVPSAEEVRLLTRRVAELSEHVKALASLSARGAAKPAVKRGPVRKASTRKVAKRKVTRADR